MLYKNVPLIPKTKLDPVSAGEDEEEREKGLTKAELFPLLPTQLGFLRKFWELQVSGLCHTNTENHCESLYQ